MGQGEWRGGEEEEEEGRKETEKAGRGEKEGEEGNRRKRKKPSALCAGALGLEIQLCYVSRPTASSFPAPRGRHW